MRPRPARITWSASGSIWALPGATERQRLLEVSDKQEALTQAQMNAVDTRYEVQNARARPDRAVGRFAYGPNEPGLALLIMRW